MSTPDTRPGMIEKQSKTRWHLLDFNFVESMARVMTLPVESGKYNEDDWKALSSSKVKRVYFSALMRHLVASMRGEVVDKDSGEPHLVCVACNAMILAWHQWKDLEAGDDVQDR